LANTWNTHQPATRIGRPDHPPYVRIDCHDSAEHRGTRCHQTSHGGGQASDPFARPQRLSDEGGG
jgi:hypothetical protein